MIDIQAAFNEAVTILGAMGKLSKLLEAADDIRTNEQKAREASYATAMVTEHFADIVNEVLADHTPRTSSHVRNPDKSLRIICSHEDGTLACNYPDEQGWRNHVSRLIAERLMKDQR